MTRQLSDIMAQPQSEGIWPITIDTNFPTPNFTLVVAARGQRVVVNGQALDEISTIAALHSESYLVQAQETVLAFDLAQGSTTITIA